MDDMYIQVAVDSVVDKLCRMSPCELMHIEDYSSSILAGNKEVEVYVFVHDFQDERHIGVVATKKLPLFGERRFVGGIEVKLQQPRRLKNEEAATRYD